MQFELELFKNLWVLNNLTERIENHPDLNFKVQNGEVVVIDEGDHYIFEDPAKFDKFIGNHMCFALTGTVFDGNNEGCES